MSRFFSSFAAILMAAAVARAADSAPAFVANVTESTALGYSNASRISVDPGGAAFFLATTLGLDNSPALRVFRSSAPLEGGRTESVYIQDRDDFIVSTLPRIGASLSRAADAGSLHVLWSGKNSSDPSDPDGAPQIHYARVETETTLTVASREQPFTVTGFDSVYSRPYRPAFRWQQDPASTVSKDGTLHVVWEARDRRRTDAQGDPPPAIAYASRSAGGKWSVPPLMDVPPYLSLNGARTQVRPIILAEEDGTMDVLCHGDWKGNLQILYGQIKKGHFSGWTPVAEDKNDQRDASAALDAQGQLHAVWREGVGGESSSIMYAVRRKSGRWSTPLFVSDGDDFASTPRIAINDASMSIVWIEWEPGFENSDDEADNDYPHDDETVEGTLMSTMKSITSDDFSEPARVSGGVSSYPAIAARPGGDTPLLLWTSGHTCAPKDCVQLYIGTVSAEK